ncbi:MAG: HAD-IC family P-type ATPase [bacterium]
MEAFEYTSIDTGLTNDEIELKEKNIISKSNSNLKTALKILINQVSSIFFILLIFSSLLSIFLDDFFNAIIFLIINLINLAIGFFQEFKAEKLSEQLYKLINVRCLVIRESKKIEIQTNDLVLGDIVLLPSGSIIPVDILVRVQKDVSIDKSIITGETIPVIIAENETLQSGCVVAEGYLIGQVVAIGTNSSFSQFQEKIAKIHKHNSFNEFIQNIGKYSLLLTVAVLSIMFVISVLMTKVLSWEEFLIFAIALLIGVIPETLPLITTVILTRSAVLLAKFKTIVKHLNTIQELGGTVFLLSDKTGTLTENKVRVAEIFEVSNISRTLKKFLTFEYTQTYMDKIFDTGLKKTNYFEKNSPKVNVKYTGFNYIKGYALFEDNSGMTIIRGQFQKISAICNNVNLEISKKNDEMESNGLRILTFATRTNPNENFIMNGLVSFEDPLKKDAGNLVKTCQNMNIHLKILTGDTELVAQYIAKKLNLIKGDLRIISLDKNKAEDLSEQTLRDTIIFAKCTPESKVTLIKKFSRIGTCAFLGEGVNDTLGLKKADVSIVVKNATDVAKQATDIILLQKSLHPIINAILLSRKAFANIMTYLFCTLTGNIGTFISVVIVMLIWGRIAMTPTQILLNNFLTDLPLTLLIFDNISKNVLKKPISKNLKLILIEVFLFGLLSCFYDLCFFFFFNQFGIHVLQTGWFLLSVLCELVLVLTLRSSLPLFKAPRPSKSLIYAIILSAGLAIGIIYFKPMQMNFNFVALSALQLSFIVGLVIMTLIINELMKYLTNRLGLRQNFN